MSESKLIRFFWVALVIAGNWINGTLWAQEVASVQMANPFWGAVGGNVFPGVCQPFGMVKLGPDVVGTPSPNNGYDRDSPVKGFSHTHTSGTGGAPRYGNILLCPAFDKQKLKDRTGFKRSYEHAATGRYSAALASDKGLVKVDLTATHGAGMHRYRFEPKSTDIDSAFIMVDISHTLTRNRHTGTRCTGAALTIVNDSIVSGHAAFIGGWGAQAPYTIYFALIFSRPFARVEGIQDGITEAFKNAIEGENIGLIAAFDIAKVDTIGAKVGISYRDVHYAMENIEEIKGWDLESAIQNCTNSWTPYLECIQVRGGTTHQQRMFYSALRNTLIMPTDVTRQTKANPGKPGFWDFYAIWDTYRTVMPLHTLLYPDKQRSIINALLQVYTDSGWLPDAWIAGHFATIQGGTNVDVVMADAMVKNLGGFDKGLAYKAMLKNAYVLSDSPQIKGRFLKDYIQLGYVTSASYKSASSRTLEYAYNDYCIAQVAKALGDMQQYVNLLQRSQNSFHLFYDSVGYFWAKDPMGNWMPNFTPQSTTKQMWNDPYFYEGGSETYSYYMPHDMQGLINRHGGVPSFVKRLDAFFDEGRFHLHNEPLFLVPYAYHYAGQPWKSVLRVREILHQQFKPAPDGLPGQDDSGAMSAWFVWSAIGLFPVAGQDVYLIGSPVFSETNIQLENGGKFTIRAEGIKSEHIYVQSISLNGKPLHRAWLTHAEITNGGLLELLMGSKPNEQAIYELPPSVSRK